MLPRFKGRNIFTETTLFIVIATSCFAASSHPRDKVLIPCKVVHNVDMAKVLELKPKDENVRLGREGFYWPTPDGICYMANAMDLEFAVAYPKWFRIWRHLMDEDKKIEMERLKQEGGASIEAEHLDDNGARSLGLEQPAEQNPEL